MEGGNYKIYLNIFWDISHFTVQLGSNICSIKVIFPIM